MDGFAARGEGTGVVVVHDGGADGCDAALQQDVHNVSPRRTIEGGIGEQAMEQRVNGIGLFQDAGCLCGYVLHEKTSLYCNV